MGTLKGVASIQIGSGGEQGRGHSVVIQNVYTSICVELDRAWSEYLAYFEPRVYWTVNNGPLSFKITNFYCATDIPT